jgi:hypothetical protein
MKSIDRYNKDFTSKTLFHMVTLFKKVFFKLTFSPLTVTCSPPAPSMCVENFFPRINEACLLLGRYEYSTV